MKGNTASGGIHRVRIIDLLQFCGRWVQCRLLGITVLQVCKDVGYSGAGKDTSQVYVTVGTIAN
jgi:hypothetical protein